MERPDTPAVAAVLAAGIDHDITVIGRVSSAEEAAASRGIPLGRLVKSLVVRRGEDDYLFVLITGDRSLDWAKLRSVLGVSRLSLPPADEAQAVTGYERGTITPFGSTHSWPVLADERVPGADQVAVGGGKHGVGIHLTGDALVAATGAVVADLTKTGN
ncbi:MAG: YbaK/EbsC family protein [Acidimicrobiia bacterium]|nr:YbaK/EbsC family protein [Acidimicrobiia bacterium]